MALALMTDLLREAEQHNKAVGAFNVANMEMIIGAIKAAETANTPIILQIAQARLIYSPFHLIAPMMVSAARATKVPVAVHLDHGQTLDVIKNALDYGFTSVMIDGSALPLEQNIAMRRLPQQKNTAQASKRSWEQSAAAKAAPKKRPLLPIPKP